MERVIPLQSNTDISDENQVVSLPSSPSAAMADMTITLPFVDPPQSLAIQAKRAWIIRNALVASNVGTCSIEAIIATVEENRNTSGGTPFIKQEEFFDIVRSLPNVRGGEVFHQLEETLERLYRIFHVVKRANLVQLICACLVLVHGSIEDKVDAAFKLMGSEYTKESLESVLTCLLLAVTALFNKDVTTSEQLKVSVETLCLSVHQAIQELPSTNTIDENVVRKWLFTDIKYNKSFPWLKLVDSTKWPQTKRLTSPASSTSSRVKSPPSSPIRVSKASMKLDEDEEEQEDETAYALHFRFSGVDGGVLTIGETEAMTLFDLLQLSSFTKTHAQVMYDTFVQHTGDGLLEEETFLEAIGELVSMTNQSHLMRETTFLNHMMDIFHCFLPEQGGKVDAFEIAAGFSLFAWGSKSEKLTASFHYFDVDSKGFLNRQQLWRFLRSVLIMLLHLSPPSSNIIARYGSLAELVDTGEQEIMENIMDSTQEEDEEVKEKKRPRTTSELHLGVYTFEEFGTWYNSGGFKGMSWLELLDLRKWMFISSSFNINVLDTEPLDPIAASTNYYSAQNLQVNIDVNGTNEENGYFHGIEERDEDKESDLPNDPPFSHHSSFASSSSSFHAPTSTVHRAMPAIVLKNDTVLEFDLVLESEQEDIPLSTLSYDNGDLIQYAELQRVTLLNQVELDRLYEVFEPFMENHSSTWIEKSTFDACIIEFLPPHVGRNVMAALKGHSSTKECKMIADMFSRFFFAFNRGGTGKIDSIEFLSAFSLFFAGSKSDKLVFTFNLFDSDGDGALTRREMWKYLRSFLTMLLVLGNGSELSAESIANVVDATAIAIANAIFKDTNKTISNQRGSMDSNSTVRGGVVSFQEFGQWYSQQGYNIITWIELLDAKKWPQVDPQMTEAILQYMNRSQTSTRGTDTGSTFRTNSQASTRQDEEEDVGANSIVPTVADLMKSPPSKRDLSSTALQFKLTSFDQMTLRIRLQDVAVVYTISERLGFSRMSCDQLLKHWNEQTTTRSLTKLMFLRSMRRFTPSSQLSNEDQEFLSFHLLRMFTLFETESVLEDEEGDDDDEEEVETNHKTSSVEKIHLLAGMCLFCNGSKSAKLGTLFKVYDVHGNGFISRRHLFEMLKSILVILFAFSSYNSNKAHANNTQAWSTHSAAERVAGAVISKLFCTAKCTSSDAISLAEFATWYAQGGYMDSPWLELLDLSKWPAKEAFEATKQEKPFLYAFDMLEAGNLLHFTQSDISTFLFMLRSTQLGEQSLSTIYNVLLTFATPSAEEEKKSQLTNDYSYAAVEEDEGAYLILNRTHYYECIRTLVPKENMSEKAQQTSSKLLSRLFNVFDRKHCGCVNVLELACGLSVLGKGSKSQKLAMVFEFITKMRQQRARALHISMRSTENGFRREKDTNALPHSVLFIYLRSFFLALMALSDGTYRLGIEKMYAEADDCIEEAMGDLMTEVSANGGMYAGYGTARSRARVTFEQFGEWYNAGGCELIPWVDLLDIAKWEQQQELQENEVTVATQLNKNFKLGSTKPTMDPIRTDTLRPTPRKKQIRQSEIVTSMYDVNKPTKEGPTPLPTAAEALSSDGPTMVFAIDPEAAELQFFQDDLTRLKHFFHQSTLHQETTWAFVQAIQTSLNSTKEITRGNFLESIQSFFMTRKKHALGEEANDLLQSVVEVFVKEPTSVNDIYHRRPSIDENDDQSMNDKLDAKEVICGFLVLCKGSLLDKLQCGATMFEANGIDHPIQTSLQSLKDTLTCFLMTLYGMSCSLSGEIIRFSAHLGVEDVIHAFLTREDVSDNDSPENRKSISKKQKDREERKKKEVDSDTIVSLQTFNAWFGEEGYHTHPWLELADFQHWPKVINPCSTP